MRLINSIRLAVRNLIERPLESAIILITSAMGIIVVISYVSLFNGLYDSVLVDIDKSGISSLLITRELITPARPSHFLKLTDIDYIKNEIRDIDQVIPIISNRYTVNIENTDNSVTTQSFATDETYADFSFTDVLEGRFFTAEEIAGKKPVCLIEKKLIPKLFPNTEKIIGQYISLKSKSRELKLEIIGVMGLEDDEQSAFVIDFYGFDNVIFPISLVMKSENTPINAIVVKAKTLDQIPHLEKELKKALAKQGRAVNIMFSQEWFDRLKLMVTVFGQLGLALTITCLVSEAIAILTIMIISVKKRFREIAIRKTEGARESDIVKQFLTEGAVLSLFGSLCGIPLGVLIAKIMSHYTVHWPIVVSWQIIVLAIVVALVVGILSSIIPAIKASKLDPIEGLKYHS